MMYRGKSGWFGNSQGHSMAARGLRLYSKKPQALVDPVFFAKKREESVSTYSIADAIRGGASFSDLMEKYPDVDKEDLRLRGIKSIEMRDGSNIMSTINNAGVDYNVRIASENPALKERMLDCLLDPQKSSFIQHQKVEFLKNRLSEVD